MSLEDDALEINDGIIINNKVLGEDSPLITGGGSSPVGLDAPVATLYVESTTSAFQFWEKFDTGVNDWKIKEFTANALIREFFTENAGASTTSSDWVNRIDEDTNVLELGDYLVMWGFALTNSINNKTVGGRVLLDDAEFSADNFDINMAGNYKTRSGIFVAKSVSGVKNLKLEYGKAAPSGGGIVTVKNATIGYIRIG